MRKLLVFVFAFVSLYSYSQSICGGSTFTLQATNPQNLTVSNYSLLPGPFVSGNGAFGVSPPVTTTYTLYTTGTNANNAVVTTSFVTTVTVNPQPTSVPSFTQASCTSSNNAINLGLTFNPATPQPAYTISWTPLPASVLSPPQFTATNLTPGPYTVIVTAAGGCATTVFFTMTPQPAPANFTVIPFGSTHSITCTQTMVVLSAGNPNLTYTWTGASFLPVVSESVALTQSNLGTVSVTGENTSSGCTSTYTFNLGINVAVPTSTISQTNISINCAQASAPTVSVTANPAVNVTHFIYSPAACGSTFAASSYTAIYNVSCPGTYTYELVNIANGCKATKFFTVTTSDFYPTFSLASPIGNFTLGCGNTSTAQLNIVNPLSGTPPFAGAVSYTIIGPPTSTVIPAPGLPLGTQQSYTVGVPGTWTVIVRDIQNGCETRVTQSIIQNIFPPLLNVNVSQTVLDCFTPSLVLEATSETENVSYNWAFGGTQPGNIASNTIAVNINTAAPTQTLINSYSLTITDLNNTCKSFSTVPILQNTYPPISQVGANSNTILTCDITSIVLTNNSMPNPLSPFPKTKGVSAYLWEGPTPQAPLQLSTSYTAAVYGNYTITGRDENNGCLSKGTYSISDGKVFPTIVSPTVTPAIIDCGAANVEIKPSYTNSATLAYTWTPPTATSVVNGNINNPSLLVKFPGTYTVTVRSTTNGCVSKATFSAVTGSLTADFTTSTDQGFAPLTVNLTNNSSSSNGTAGITTAWNYGNGVSFTTSPTASVLPQAIYSQPGTYTVNMYVNKGACLAQAFKVIKVEIPSAIQIPNVFTPNNDGTNDLFFLRSNNLTDISAVIFDRWGHIVYEVTSTTGNIEWDGKNGQGKDAAEGTYFYVIKATGKDGSAFDKKGTVSLYR